MAKQCTELELKRAGNRYKLTMTYREGAHETGVSGMAFYELKGGVIVEMQMGGLEPIQVYKNIDEVRAELLKRTGIEPLML